MKKFIVGLVVGANIGLFFGTTLHAQGLVDNIGIINMATDDLRNISVYDIECQKTIIEFYEIANKNDQNFTQEYKDSVSLKYKDCMTKKETTTEAIEQVEQEHNESIDTTSNDEIKVDENIVSIKESNIDEECKNKVMSFYGVLVKNTEENINLTQEYKDCIAKKQNGKRIKAEKVIEEAQREAITRELQSKKVANFNNRSDKNDSF